jgi:hypothetical protein
MNPSKAHKELLNGPLTLFDLGLHSWLFWNSNRKGFYEGNAASIAILTGESKAKIQKCLTRLKRVGLIGWSSKDNHKKTRKIWVISKLRKTKKYDLPF